MDEINELTSMSFTIQDVRRAFPWDYFERGQEYYRQGKVKNLALDRTNSSVYAVVQGNGKKPYQVAVTFKAMQNKFLFEGNCSCPIGYNCKHVVATLLQGIYSNVYQTQFLEKKSSGTTSPITQKPPIILSDTTKHWLNSLTSTLTQNNLENSDSVQANGCVIYLLSQPAHSKEVCVELAIVKYLKKGGYGTPRFIASEHQLYLKSTESYLTAKDWEWISLLEVYDEKILKSYYTSGVKFSIYLPAQVEILIELIKSGRCHWQTVENPALRLGAPKEAHLQWVVKENGNQVAQLYENSQPIQIALLFEQPWYLDTQRWECGPLKILGLADNLQHFFAGAPTISVEELPVVNEKFKELSLPLLNELPPNSFSSVSPIPHAHFFTAEIPNYYMHNSTYYLMRVELRYEKASIEFNSPRNIIHHWDGQQLKSYLRNFDQEQALLSILAHQNLRTLKAEAYNYIGPYKDCYIIKNIDHFVKNTLLALEKRGWTFSFDATFPYQPTLKYDEWYYAIEDENKTSIDWFELELGVVVQDKKINLLPILINLFKQNPLYASMNAAENNKQVHIPLEDGRIIEISSKRLKFLFDTFNELADPHIAAGTQSLRLSAMDAQRLNVFADTIQKQDKKKVQWLGGEQIKTLAKKLTNFTGIKTVKIPLSFQGQLRPYQQSGVNWLQFLREYQLAGILADDMGLGKTIQTLAHLLIEKESKRMKQPTLVIAPTSLMFNWEHEANRFAPNLKVLRLHGKERKQFAKKITNYDLILTTYPLLVRDQAILLKQKFYLVILDEAQNIKNPQSQMTQIVQKISSQYRLCLTGTPLENHLGELWSLFNFLMPGFLGELKQFTRFFRTPIEKHNDLDRRVFLMQRVKPFLLRRTKQAILNELPPKVEIIRQVELDGEIRDLYETTRIYFQQKVQQHVELQGWARSRIVILDALLKLRQICCDHRLLSLDQAKKVKDTSPKLQLLLELLVQLLDEGRKILLFSQFTSMLELIEEALQAQSIEYVKLTGQTLDRETPVRKFQSGEVSLFLISLKAGGVGLNLTAADTVIHYDPWWNPAVENQATDRAHRIGQKNTVFIYKLITQGTVEEKIYELQQRKKALLHNLFSETETQSFDLNSADLDQLFKPL